jgi:hypothetical protein
MEKENQFLRLEVEKSKYSKDKEGYSRFIQGLIKHRGPSTSADQTSLTRRREEPLQELQISKVNTSSNNNRQQQIQMSES